MPETATPTEVDVDLDLLRAIRDVRSAKGACTVRNVAAQLGLTSSGVQHRLAKAEAAGHVEKSDVAGSIRPTLDAGETVTITMLGATVNFLVHDDEVLEVRLA